MNSPKSKPTPLGRRLLSWLEISLGLVSVSVGGWQYASVFIDSFGDPHGLAAVIGGILTALGITLLVAGLCLRLRGHWPWLLQCLPLLVAGSVFLLLD